MNGIISPQCPMITRSPGCRANVPAAASRSVCSPASACHPQALVASALATGAASPEYSPRRIAAGGSAGCRYSGTSSASNRDRSTENDGSSRNRSLVPRVLWISPPANPREATHRDSSSAASGGDPVGSVANPASRPADDATTAAR